MSTNKQAGGNSSSIRQTDSQTHLYEIASPSERRLQGGFRLSRPKNYLGVPAAVAADQPTGPLVMQHLVSMGREAKRGAQRLGLLDRTDPDRLTRAGAQLVELYRAEFGGVDTALTELGKLKGRQGRLFTNHNVIGSAAQAALLSIPLTRSIISVLQQSESKTGYTLPELVRHLAERDPKSITGNVIDGDAIPVNDPVAALADQKRSEAVTACPWLADPETYTATFTSQFKSLCCHAGILTQPGADTTRLTPVDDRWQLSPYLSEQLLEAVDDRSGGDA